VLGRSLIGLCYLTGFHPAFGQASNASPTGTVHDSGGIRIIQSAPNSRAVVLAAQPTVRLGGLNKNLAIEFDAGHPFLSSVRLTDGSIAVADYSSIKLFDAAGGFLRSAGRRGSGPGEFRQLRELCVVGKDSLLAIDYSDNRISLWTTKGELIRDFPRIGYLPLNPCLQGQSVLVETPSKKKGAGWTDLVIKRWDGTLIGFFLTIPHDETFGRAPRRVSLAALGSSIYVADGRAFEVRRFKSDGTLQSIFRVRAPSVAITEANKRPVGQQPPGARSAESPRNYPPYYRMKVDQDGRYWIQDYIQRTMWTVYDANGQPLGTLLLAGHGTDETLLQVVGDHVAIRFEDSDGAAQIAYYRYTFSTSGN